MASQTPWYTPYNQQFSRIQAPQAGGGGGGGSPVYDLLREQGNIRNAIARSQYQQMQEGLESARQKRRQSRDLFRGRHGTNADKEARKMQPQLMAEQLAAAQAQRQRMQRENQARDLVVGESMRGAPRNFQDYNRLATMKQQTGGQTGRAHFQEPPMQSMGAGAPSRMAKMAQASQGIGPVERLQMSGRPESRPSGGRAFGGRGIGSARPYKKGSLPGTVPETGPAKLHKNEIVISADQVDEPLLHYLKTDKLRKLRSGQMDGKGTGPGTPPTAASMIKDEFQAGSLPSYQGGSMMMLPGYGDPFGFQREPPDPSGLEYPGRGPLSEEELMKITESRPDLLGEGAEWLGGLAKGAFEGAGDIGEGLGEGVGGLGESFMEGFDPGGPQGRLDEAVGAAQIPPPELIDMGTPEIGTSLLQQEIAPDPGRDLEVARGRVAQGDLGAPDAPLTLRGGDEPFARGDEDLPPEDRYFAPEEPKWRQAENRRTMAVLNRQKADRLMDFLASNGSDLDDKSYTSMMTEVKHLRQVSDDVEKQAQQRKQAYQKAMSDMNQVLGDIEQEKIKAQAGVEEISARGRQEAEQKLDDTYRDMEMALGQASSEQEINNLLMLMAKAQQQSGANISVDELRRMYEDAGVL